MKAVLEFSLPEEQQEFQTAVDAWKYRAVVEDLVEHLRGRIKHGTMPARVRETYEKVRGELFSIVRDRGVDLDQ